MIGQHQVSLGLGKRQVMVRLAWLNVMGQVSISRLRLGLGFIFQVQFVSTKPTTALSSCVTVTVTSQMAYSEVVFKFQDPHKPLPVIYVFGSYTHPIILHIQQYTVVNATTVLKAWTMAVSLQYSNETSSIQICMVLQAQQQPQRGRQVTATPTLAQQRCERIDCRPEWSSGIRQKSAIFPEPQQAPRQEL